MEDYDNTVKAQEVSKEVLKYQMKEYVENYDNYKKLDKMMKQYEANIKEYMKKNEIDILKTEGMVFNLKVAFANILDRTLIPNIRQYYSEQKRYVLSKSKCKGKMLDL